MRGPRITLAAALILGAASMTASAQFSPSDLLTKFRPTQKGVEYDNPTEPAAVSACKVEQVQDAKKKVIGYALRDGQGKLLRRFVDSNGNLKLDQWSYYLDGFEVYREVDTNDDQVLDECHWLNQAGTRVATVARNKITSWKRLSAEESSKVLVQSLVAGDLSLLDSVMVTAEELEGLGLPQPELERIKGEASSRQAQVEALLKKLAGWDAKTVWVRFDGMMPRSIPGDAAAGLKGDLILYENAVVFAGQPDGKGDPSKMAYLQLPEMVRIGESWKIVDLPRVIDPGQANIELPTRQVGLRTALYRQDSGSGGESASPELQVVLNKLAEFDNKALPTLAGAEKKVLANYHFQRVQLLRDILKLVKTGEDELVYKKQIVDSLVEAVKTGLYPPGREVLEKMAKEGGKIQSYTSFRLINLDYQLKTDEPGTQLLAAQKWLMERLVEYVKEYPGADETSEVLFQLASLYEFNADEDDARKYYSKLATDFPDTAPGRKAAGALRRLDLVGKTFDLKATDVEGQKVDTTAYRGKILAVVFWAGWAEPARRDVPELVKLYQKYHSKGLEMVGINLDGEKETLDKIISSDGVNWPQVHETGGMDGKLANDYGIISLPTMVLVDPQGKVISRTIRLAAELEKQLEKSLANRPPGVALDSNR